MPTFVITYRPGHSLGVETVEADEARVEGSCVVLVLWRLVIFDPRRVVVRRIALRDVVSVEPSDADVPEHDRLWRGSGSSR